MREPARRPSASGGTAVRRKTNKKRAVLLITILASVFVVAMAVVLMGIADNRRYNDYMNQAQYLFYNRDYDGALAALRKASSVERTEECLLLMADCYQTQENYTKTLEVLRMMDLNKPAVAARIAEVESLRKSLEATETVYIAGRDYPVNTSRLVLDNMELGDASLIDVTQLYAIDSLSMAGNVLRNISRLAALGGLVNLNLSDNEIMDISPLASLTGLRNLYLDNNPIRDFSPLYALENLKTLSIKGIEITETQLSELSRALRNCAVHSEKAQQEMQDISFGGVTFASDVTDLDLSDMGIWDISALSGCQYITRLNLSGNMISDLSPLMNLPYLQWLDISSNNVVDLKPLMGISTLYFLNAANNAVSSTSALTMMTGLNTLYLDGNPIHDFTGLRKLKSVSTLGLNETGLRDGDLPYLYGLQTLGTLNIMDNPDLTGAAVDTLKSYLPGCMVSHSAFSVEVYFSGRPVPGDSTSLRMSGQGVTDISAVQMLGSLQTVDLSINQISNLYPLAFADCRRTITSMNLSYNALSDLTPLSMLTAIESLDLSYNQITSLQPLMGLTTLRNLRISGNPLTLNDISAICMALPECNVIF